MNDPYMEMPRSAFASLLDHAGGRPRDDDPGPYDPREDVVRAVLALLHWRWPRPNWALADTVRLPVALVELLRESAGPFPEPWRWSALNPQPLPPRLATALWLAQAVAEKVILVHELAGTLPEDERARAAGFALDQLSQFVRDAGDDRCPIWWWMRRPFPWPGPRRDDLTDGITPAELVAMGALFENSAAAAPDGLRRDLAAAGQKLMTLGLSRLETAAPAEGMAGARPS